MLTKLQIVLTRIDEKTKKEVAAKRFNDVNLDTKYEDMKVVIDALAEVVDFGKILDVNFIETHSKA